jgi:hypothetical protein
MLNDSKQLEDNGLFYVLIMAILLLPGHQIIHLAALLLLRKKVQIKKKWFFPSVSVKYCELLSKPAAVLTVLAPLFFFSTILLGGSLMFPQYTHYFTILAAINIGICVSDLLYSYQFMKAPRKCMLEENNGGYDILIHKPDKIS